MELQEHFVKAASEIMINLGMQGFCCTDFHETENRGLDYTAQSKSEIPGFYLHLRTNTKEKDPQTGKMTISISIYFDETHIEFSFFEDITYLKGHPNYLCRWVFWAIYNFRIKHQTFNLKNTFSDSTIRVYGSEGHDLDTGIEIVLGYLNTHSDESIVCYKMGHVDPPYFLRNYTYAIFVQPKKRGTGFWAFFPDCAGLDSGGTYMSYRFMEEQLNELSQSNHLEIRRVDVPFEEVKNHLIKHSESFLSMHHEEFSNTIWFTDEPSSRLFNGSEDPFNEFLELYENQRFPHALRCMRALVQQAQENLLTAKTIDLPDNPNVTKLAGLLVKEKLLDGRMITWFETFTSVANLSSHRDYPNAEDMQDRMTRKTLTARSTGFWESSTRTAVHPGNLSRQGLRRTGMGSSVSSRPSWSSENG